MGLHENRCWRVGGGSLGVSAVVAVLALGGCGGDSKSAGTSGDTSSALRTAAPGVKAAFVECAKTIEGWTWQDGPPAPQYRQSGKDESPNQTFQDKVIVGNEVTERVGTLVWTKKPTLWMDYYLAPNAAASEAAIEKLTNPKNLARTDGKWGYYEPSVGNAKGGFFSTGYLDTDAAGYPSGAYPETLTVGAARPCMEQALG